MSDANKESSPEEETSKAVDVKHATELLDQQSSTRVTTTTTKITVPLVTTTETTVTGPSNQDSVSKPVTPPPAPPVPPPPPPPSRMPFALLLCLVVYLLDSGVLHSLRLYVLPESRVWMSTSPEMSTCEFMNASAFAQAGPTSSVLKKVIFPKPIRGVDQVMVKVVKAGGNPVDFKMRQMASWPMISLPSITGFDFAGIVTESPKESAFQPGDRVLGMLPAVSPIWGTFAEYVAVNQDFMAKIPANVSFSDAAALPLAGLTAIQALSNLVGVQPNETVLIHAGSGGVGIYLIQLAKQLLKLKVYTTSTNAELCKSLGADVVIDYRKQDFAAQEYDYIIDLIGGDYVLRGLNQARKNYVSILNTGWKDYFGLEFMVAVGELATMAFAKTRRFLTMGAYAKYNLVVVHSDGHALQVMAQMLANQQLRSVIDEEFVGLDEGARKVHDRLQTARAKGKVILSIQ